MNGRVSAARCSFPNSLLPNWWLLVSGNCLLPSFPPPSAIVIVYVVLWWSLGLTLRQEDALLQQHPILPSRATADSFEERTSNSVIAIRFPLCGNPDRGISSFSWMEASSVRLQSLAQQSPTRDKQPQQEESVTLRVEHQRKSPAIRSKTASPCLRPTSTSARRDEP